MEWRSCFIDIQKQLRCQQVVLRRKASNYALNVLSIRRCLRMGKWLSGVSVIDGILWGPRSGTVFDMKKQATFSCVERAVLGDF
jgi:hypothetical protein